MNSLPNSSPTMPTFRAVIWVLSRLSGGSPAARTARRRDLARVARRAFLGLALDQVAQERERHPRVLVDLDATLVEPRLHRQVAVVADVEQSVHHPVEVAVSGARRQTVVVGDVDVGEVLAHLV